MTVLLVSLALAATAIDAPAPPEPPREILLAQMTIKIERNSIIRVPAPPRAAQPEAATDRKSTRLNSSHVD